MTGKHHIVLETDRLKYEFDIKRNITVIQGESATGKTTLIDILQEYERQGERSGIRLQSDVACVVYSGNPIHWTAILGEISHSIVFFDEDYPFVFSDDFAAFIRETDNYYVFITRRPLKNLPYSINEIYGIRTSGKYHFPQKVYYEFYPIYNLKTDELQDPKNVILITEDSQSGHQFFSNVNDNILCISAEGNANIYYKLLETEPSQTVVILADGAAFGAFISKLVLLKRKNMAFYFPESFEWLILKSGTARVPDIDQILAHPEEYIESRKFFNWERFFSHLLEKSTENDRYKQYHKNKLSDYYLQKNSVDKVLSVIPEQIKDLLKT